MADAPEIPNATDPFEKMVAISIAALAVALSLISNKGDNAKTDAIIQTNEASNQWARYQSKSIKSALALVESDLLARLQPAPQATDIPAQIEKLKGEQARYDADEKEITALAKAAQASAATASSINDRCDLASLAIQIGIVLASVSILSRWKALWLVSLALGIAGAIIGATAFFL